MTAHRSHPRAPLNVYINKIVGETLYMCRAADISEEGIYVSRLIEPDLTPHKPRISFPSLHKR